MSGETTLRIEACLNRLHAGDAAARDELLSHSLDRLQRLSRKLFADFDGLRRWVGSDDVMQDAVIRLTRALASSTPASAREYFRLAALQIRRELIDLARHYRGPHGAAAHHKSWGVDSTAPQPAERSSVDPARLAEWTEWHHKIANLPDEEREVVELLWYHGLPQQEAADTLGVALRTLKRRWQKARLLLHQELKDAGGME